MRVQVGAFVVAEWIQDGGHLAIVLVNGENGSAQDDGATGPRYENTVKVARVVVPRTVHVILRSFHSAAVQLHKSSSSSSKNICSAPITK